MWQKSQQDKIITYSDPKYKSEQNVEQIQRRKNIKTLPRPKAAEGGIDE
jgi:hypothetical protein